MILDDDDPFWEQHSGKDLHESPDWQDGDSTRALALYSAVSQGTRTILDYLMDRPGELADVDNLAGQIRDRRPGETATSHRRAVAGSLTSIRRPVVQSGRRAPFHWWARSPGFPARSAMKPRVARVFRGARNAGPGPAGADPARAVPSGGARPDDWTEAEVSATVDDYLAMLAAEMAGQRYSKTAHGRALREKLNGSRSKGAFEFKHQNISAVMISLGLPYIRGYKPKANIQGALAEEIQRRLEEDPACSPHYTPPRERSPAAQRSSPGHHRLPQKTRARRPRKEQAWQACGLRGAAGGKPAPR